MQKTLRTGCLVLLFFLTACCIQGAEGVKERLYGFLGSKDTLRVQTPADWQESLEKTKDALLTVSYHPAGRDEVVYFSAFLAVQNIDLREVAAKLAEPALDSAVETELVLNEVRSETVHGYWYRLTDRTLIGKQPEKDNYLYLIQAAVAVQRYLIIVTALTNDPGQEFIDEIMAMMESFRVE